MNGNKCIILLRYVIGVMHFYFLYPVMEATVAMDYSALIIPGYEVLSNNYAKQREVLYGAW